jgi:hypothetical protein
VGQLGPLGRRLKHLAQIEGARHDGEAAGLHARES